MYCIEFRSLSGWEPYGLDDEDQPIRFATVEEARLDLYENHMDCLEAIKAGHMHSTAPLSDFRIVLLGVGDSRVLEFNLSDTGTLTTINLY